MAGRRQIFFTAEGVLDLLTHYSDGKVPLNAKLIEAGVNPYLGRCIGLLIESKDYGDEDELRFLHVRYEGRKVLTWDGGENPIWVDEGVGFEPAKR